MNGEINEIKNDIEKFLKDDPLHHSKHIDYILADSRNKEIYAVASNGDDEIIAIMPYMAPHEKEYRYCACRSIPEWDYNYDSYLYEYLEEGKEIAYMNDEVHYSIWNSIKESYPEDITFKKGMQNYLQYCRKNKITKEYLDKMTGLNTPDIMKKNFHKMTMNIGMEI